MSTRLFRLKYGWKGRATGYLNNLLFIISIGLMFPLLLFEVLDQYPVLSQILIVSITGWLILYMLETSEKHRFYMRCMNFLAGKISEGEDISEQTYFDLLTELKIVRDEPQHDGRVSS